MKENFKGGVNCQVLKKSGEDTTKQKELENHLRTMAGYQLPMTVTGNKR